MLTSKAMLISRFIKVPTGFNYLVVQCKAILNVCFTLCRLDKLVLYCFLSTAFTPKKLKRIYVKYLNCCDWRSTIYNCECFVANGLRGDNKPVPFSWRLSGLCLERTPFLSSCAGQRKNNLLPVATPNL